MTNAEMIKALQCASHFALYQDCYEKNCYANSGKGLYCNIPKLMADAADALEAAEKRIKELESQAAFFDAEKLNYQENIVYRDELIKELEAQLPKEGEWIPINWTYDSVLKCSNCGELACCFGDYCPNCGAKMKGENDGES